MKSPSTRFVRRLLPLLAAVFGLGIVLTGQHSPRFSLVEFEPEAEAEAEEHEAKPGADEWFYEQRAYPLQEVPPGARARAVEQLEVLEERQQLQRQQLYGRQAAETIADSQPKWEAVGPRPIGPVVRANAGRATAIALDPGYDGVNNQTLYVGAAQGGVWKSTDNGVNWTPITEDMPSLAVGSLAVDPSNPQVIYVGTGEGNASADCYYSAGLYKSVNGGASWRVIEGPLSTGASRLPVFRYMAIKDIEIDPRNPQIIYLATRTASTYGPAGGAGVIAPTQRGIWKSFDGGETWTNLDPPNTGGTLSASDVMLHPNDSTIVYATIFARGIYRSNAGGASGTWQLLGGGLPTADVQRIELAAGPVTAPSTKPTLYAVIANGSSGLHGVYRSTDDGDTWTATAGLPASIGQTGYNLSLSVDSQNASILYLGLVSFYRSLDGGATWQNQTAGNGAGSGAIHVDQHFSVVVKNKPNIFFIANDGGIWRSDNANGTAAMGWTTLNTTLNTVQFQGVSVHPENTSFLIGGTQDNGTLRFTGDPAWLSIAGGDGGFSLIDQSNPNILWQSFQNSNRTSTQTPSFGPRVSTNGGTNFTDRGCRASCQATPGGFNSTDRVGFYSPMAQHTGFTQPNNVVYWGTHRLYRTTDLGVTWTGLGPSTDGFGQDLTASTTARLTAIAAQPKLDTTTMPPGEIVWTGSSNGQVFVTTNAGKLAEATFANVTKAPLPNRFVSSIAVDPNEPKRAYVAYSGFNIGTPTTPGHIFVTDDLGQTWRDISGDLPDVPVTAVEPDPTQAGTLYIGTDIGVFQTTDNGATWVPLSNGMPRVATFMVKYHKATRSLVVATHGRGIFRLKLAAPLVTVSSASFSREALAVEGIASAFGTGLATRNESARSIPLPTELAGTRVQLTDANGVDHLAPLFFVSPQQVNYQIPPAVAPGALTVTITSGDNMVSFGIERVRSVAPALFTANSTGRGVPSGYGVRVRDGVQSLIQIAQTVPTATPPLQPAEIDLGPAGDQVVLVLFGTGLRRRPDLSGVDVTIGGVRVPAQYAGEVAGLVGLDQLNFGVPRSLIGRGEVDVVVNVSGVVGNTVRVRIK